MDIVFSSTVPRRCERTLERLVYFNRSQLRARQAIVRALDLYGQPRISTGPGGLCLSLDAYEGAQCLFALTRRRGELVVMGMVIYIRPTADQVVVVHLALSGIMTDGSKARTGLLIRLLRQVRKIASRVRGVNRIRLPYVERSSLLTTGTGGNVLPFNAPVMEAVPLGESRSCLVA